MSHKLQALEYFIHRPQLCTEVEPELDVPSNIQGLEGHLLMRKPGICFVFEQQGPICPGKFYLPPFEQQEDLRWRLRAIIYYSSYHR